MSRIAVIGLTLILGACGDGESDSATASATEGSEVETGDELSLQIGGTPPSEILAGSTVSFTPTVVNPDEVALTFSASNLPDWATIDSTTGEITAAPTAADVGVYSNIRVTVFGGGSSDTTPAYSIEVVAVGTGSATLSWAAPTENSDGSALVDLAGYKVYWGITPNSLNNSVTIDNPGITNYVVENLTPATWYFAARAFNSEGVESSMSNTAQKTIL